MSRRHHFHTLARHFSTAANLPKLPRKHRGQAIQVARQALTDYLHSTKSLSFTWADLIARNSPTSLSNLISSLDFFPSDFSRTLRRHLSYHPINEFEFFFESIGIDPRQIASALPRGKFFLSEDRRCLDAACALFGFGFPWNRLGQLYMEEASIFGLSQEELSYRIGRLKSIGFNPYMVIAICFTFPRALVAEGSEVDALFHYLKRVLLDSDLQKGSLEENVDSWCKVCKMIRLFYDFGLEEDSVEDPISRCIGLVVEYPEEVLVQKVNHFRRFGLCDREVASLILDRTEVLRLNLETQSVSVVGFLKYFGLSAAELEAIALEYRHVLGRGRVANLPHILKAMNLSQWFLSKIRDENLRLLANYIIIEHDPDLDEDYVEGLVQIKSSRYCVHAMHKLNFLHGIGFGENGLTIQILKDMHGTSCELHERFDRLLSLSIEYWKLCRMIAYYPKIMNQSAEALEQKVCFLQDEMGSLDSLYEFPAVLCFHLENRIRPRYSFHMWLMKSGLDSRKVSVASLFASSEKQFLGCIFRIHPAAVKIWLENHSRQRS